MDLPLLRKLQVMRRIEDDPSRRFQTKTFELASLTPMYRNVIIIDQNADESLFKRPCPFIVSRSRSTDDSTQGPVHLQVVAKKIKDVGIIMQFYSKLLIRFMSGWSVILKEGLYIEPWISFIEETDGP